MPQLGKPAIDMTDEEIAEWIKKNPTTSTPESRERSRQFAEAFTKNLNRNASKSDE
jgi:hypothetical protein